MCYFMHFETNFESIGGGGGGGRGVDVFSLGFLAQVLSVF